MFNYTDVGVLTALYVFVHWQTARNTGQDRGWYASGVAQIRGRGGGWAPPGWLFGVAWWTLYKLIVAALFIFFRETPDTAWTFLAVFVVAGVNVLLNKAWSVLFWDAGRTGWALVVAVLMLLTAVAVVVFVALTPGNALWGLVLGLYVPYPVWLLVAIYLNVWWYRLGLSTTKQQPVVAAAAPSLLRQSVLRHRPMQ